MISSSSNSLSDFFLVPFFLADFFVVDFFFIFFFADFLAVAAPPLRPPFLDADLFWTSCRVPSRFSRRRRSLC